VFRIGFGYDVHRLVEGRSLIIGGCRIPHPFGLLGHSDADVLIHAVMDAILGALAMGDIGRHFPDSDPDYKDADSLELLKKVMAWTKEKGFLLNNLDTTIVAQEPKLSPHIPDMKQKLSEILDLSADRLNIKATTSEGLGFTGRKEGIAAYAVVSLAARDAGGRG
jgi:2-C-methyl-D-erythritol 2,4-cyclodiphosphate synthase